MKKKPATELREGPDGVWRPAEARPRKREERPKPPRREKLTERTVAGLKAPASGKLDVWDQTLPAFGIQLRSTGRRTWIVAVRRPGKSTTSRIKIGDAATMPLAEARELARTLMREPGKLAKRDAGPADFEPEIDPDSLTADSPMADVITAFIAQRRAQKRNRTWRATEQLLRHDLAGWYGRPLGSITKGDVRQVLASVITRGSPSTANLLLANIRRMFNWAIERELIEVSPAAAIRPPSPKVERERTLTDPELYEVWHGAERLGWPFGPVVQLLMLTAQREGEVAAMRWSEIDLDKGLWSLPSTRTKAGRAHLVPLSSTALQIIQAQPRLGEYVFPGRRTDGARPVCGFSKVKVRLDRISGVQSWTFHDLRRTAATRLAELHVPPHVTEKILNHASSRVAGPMARVYQVYDYLAERREALQLWADTLGQIVEPGRRTRKAA